MSNIGNMIDLSNLDENDLKLDDLDSDNDDDAVINQFLNQTANTQNVVEKESTKKDSNNNNNNNNNPDDDDDDLLFKVPEPIVTNVNKPKVIDKTVPDHPKEAIEDFNEDDEDDFLIKNQSIFCSTQYSTQKLDEDEFKKPFLPTQIVNEPQEAPYNHDVDDDNDLIDRVFNKNSALDITLNTSSRDKSSDAVDNCYVWNYATNHLNSLLAELGLGARALEKYSLDYYLKTLFEFNLVKGADEGVPKLPLACLYITEIARKDRNSNSVVTLMNENFQLKGTISKSVTKDHWDKLSVGAVLLLQNVCMVRINVTKLGYHLNINNNNLLYIYYKDVEASLNKIKLFKLNEIRTKEIKNYINNFETKYVKIDKNLVLNSSTSFSNKSNLNVTCDKRQAENNKSVNVNNRPAPYKIPDNLKNRTTNQPTVTGTSKTTSNPNNVQVTFAKPAEPLHTLNETANRLTASTSAKKTTTVEANKPRSFSFKPANQNKPSINNQSVVNLDDTVNVSLNQTKSNTSIQIFSSSQKTISEEALSQLIFGIEDEFLQDDNL